MPGAEITTRHMLFSLIVSLLSATDHDDLSALCFVRPNYDVCRLPLGMAFGFTFRSAQLSYMPSTAVSDFRLLSFVHPNSLSIRAIPRIIFFRGLNSQDFNKVVGGPSSIGVISHKNPDPAVLEYALPEGREAGFST